MTAPARARPALGDRVRRGRRLLRTTRPGRLIAHGALVLVLVLLAGVLGLIAVTRADAAAADVAGRDGSRTVTAQQLYRALSDADAAAASGFLAGRAEPAEVRLRYQTDLTVAGTALAALGGSDSDTATTTEPDPAATTLATGLPVYAGLVETARTADRQGLAVGGAYLREASSFMQGELLPAAQSLYARDAAALAAAQETADGTVWGLLALLVGIGALVVAYRLHRTLAATTHRRVNTGLLVTGIALVLALFWGGIALIVQGVGVATQRAEGTTPAGLAVQARFTGLTARTDETLTLVARGSGAAYETAWQERFPTLLAGGGSLDSALGATAPGAPARTDLLTAQEAARAAAESHRQVRALDDGGDYDAAVALALSPQGAAGAYARLDDALDRAIRTLDADAAQEAADAAAATTGLAVGTAVLTLLAVAGLVVGLWPRLQEYR